MRSTLFRLVGLLVFVVLFFQRLATLVVGVGEVVKADPLAGLTEGRMVHFVMPDGEHRPAVIVRVWHFSGVCDGHVNLQVFTDGTNDGQANAAGIVWQASICYDANKGLGTWHWIEYAS
jgi:hypothetical protein